MPSRSNRHRAVADDRTSAANNESGPASDGRPALVFPRVGFEPTDVREARV